MNEITMRTGFSIRKNGLTWPTTGQSQYKVDWTGPSGPTPGAILATQAGTVVDLSKLTTYGGPIHIANVDQNGEILRWGLYYSGTGHYEPIGYLLPGWSTDYWIDPDFGKEESGTGSGTRAGGVQLMLRSNEAAGCRAVVEAYDP